jgi:branched chain amino acid efflux pump
MSGRASETAVSTVWIVVIVSGLGTLALKAAGPVLLGGKPLPGRFTGVVSLLGPALLAALVAIGTFADGQRLVLDGRVLGVGAAAVAIRFHVPVLLVVIIAAAVTAAARVLAG